MFLELLLQVPFATCHARKSISHQFKHCKLASFWRKKASRSSSLVRFMAADVFHLMLCSRAFLHQFSCVSISGVVRSRCLQKSIWQILATLLPMHLWHQYKVQGVRCDLQKTFCENPNFEKKLKDVVKKNVQQTSMLSTIGPSSCIFDVPGQHRCLSKVVALRPGK